MGHYRNSGLYNGLDLRNDFHTALQLHRIAPAFFHKASRIGYGLIDGCLIGHKRHIDDHKGIFRTPGHGGAMMDHIFHRYGKGILITENHISERITDKNSVNSGVINQTCHRIIIGSHIDSFFPSAFAFLNVATVFFILLSIPF